MNEHARDIADLYNCRCNLERMTDLFEEYSEKVKEFQNAFLEAFPVIDGENEKLVRMYNAYHDINKVVDQYTNK